MLIEKIIDTRIDILDYVAFFANEGVALSVLAHQYENTCYANSFIIKVTQIIRQSRCTVTRGLAYIDVTFRATALVYKPGDVIVGCKVINRTQVGGVDYILAETPHCSVIATSTKSLESIHAGQLVPLRVGKSKYSIGSNKITICATPLSHDDTNKVYKINKLSLVNKEALAPLIDLIATIKPTKDRAWMFFDDLLYAYNTPKTVNGVDLMTAIDNMHNYDTISMPAAVKQTSGTVVVNAPGDAIEIATNTNIAMLLLQAHYDALKLVADMVEVYNTPDLINSHKNIWLILKHIKLG